MFNNRMLKTLTGQCLAGWFFLWSRPLTSFSPLNVPILLLGDLIKAASAPQWAVKKIRSGAMLIEVEREEASWGSYLRGTSQWHYRLLCALARSFGRLSWKSNIQSNKAVRLPKFEILMSLMRCMHHCDHLWLRLKRRRTYVCLSSKGCPAVLDSFFRTYKSILHPLWISGH